MLEAWTSGVRGRHDKTAPCAYCWWKLSGHTIQPTFRVFPTSLGISFHCREAGYFLIKPSTFQHHSSLWEGLGYRQPINCTLWRSWIYSSSYNNNTIAFDITDILQKLKLSGELIDRCASRINKIAITDAIEAHQRALIIMRRVTAAMIYAVQLCST